MCPACMPATLALILTGAASMGGVAAVFVKKRRSTAPDNRDPKVKSKEKNMEHPRIVTRDEWLAQRKELLHKEKELTRQRDELSAERRNLPMVKVEKDYIFEGPQGPAPLRSLFGPHRQLIVYHFMFDPSWEEGCKSCSYLTDNISGGLVHLAARNTAFAAVSRAPLQKLEQFRKRMGWTFPWFSSFGNDFNYDFQVTLDEEKNSTQYNYLSSETLFQTGKIWMRKGELPGMSVFLREGDDVYHTYSAYQRGLDLFLGTYNLLDLTPLGRQEDQEPQVMSWLRHHDRYPG